ncbi:MAG TPA: RNA polymerase sigma factor [Gammaproteobacteria bacterium]
MRFAELYEAHYRRVYGLCRRLLGAADRAEDAAQETFLRAQRALHRYDPSQPFGPWIMSIATRHCLDLLRRRAKERELFGSEETERLRLVEDRATVLGSLLVEERAERLRQAIAALPERYRVPLVLAYYDDRTYDEIAAALGITRTHVGVLINRAKQALRRALPPEGRNPE